MSSATPRKPISTLDARKLPPVLRERLERDLRVAARALQLCGPFQRLCAHLQRKCPGVDVTSELRLVHAGEECAHPYLQMAWHWMYMIHPLAYVGPLDPEDREELALDDIVYTSESLLGFLDVFGVDATELREHPLGEVEDRGDHWVSEDPRDVRRVPAALDLGMPNEELVQGIELLRAITGIRAGQLRPSRARTWDSSEGWRVAFDLVELASKDPDLNRIELAKRVWPHRFVSRKRAEDEAADRKSAAQQARRLIEAAEVEIEVASARVCRVLDLRRRAAEARRNPSPPPRIS